MKKHKPNGIGQSSNGISQSGIESIAGIASGAAHGVAVARAMAIGAHVANAAAAGDPEAARLMLEALATLA